MVRVPLTTQRPVTFSVCSLEEAEAFEEDFTKVKEAPSLMMRPPEEKGETRSQCNCAIR